MDLELIGKTSRGRGQPAAAAGATGRARLMSHADLQAEIIRMCDARGLLVHYDPDPRRGRRGFPDLVIAGLGGAVFVELKTPRDIVRPDQRLWLKTLEAAGCEIHVWRPAHLVTGEVRRTLDRIRLAGPPVQDPI